MSDFHDSRLVKRLQKRRLCEHCGKGIEIGEPAEKAAGVYEGEFYTLYSHPECQVAGNAYAKMTGCWWDEYTWFQHAPLERQDKQWLLEEHPVVAARLGLTVEEVNPELA